MTSDMTPSRDERIWEIEVQGGVYPSARRSRNRLKVSQRQLSTVLQRIHRMGGKILSIKCASSNLSLPLKDGDSIGVSHPSSVMPISEGDEERATADAPEIAEPEARAIEPEPTPQRSVQPQVQRPVAVYSLFPRRRIDRWQVQPVRPLRQSLSREKKRRFWYCDRQLSIAKVRRQFFSSQALRRRRRR
ncbi:phycobilisome linker polypeptide [Roseofilum casamattae]|uniref:Phycobilisome linker polypeptide n=1 Tax=Roseofilum casamattae BLCC-M143 TaxID=3022442 RepID=A0ABT7BSK0_9CYAN|nr:phycobilisome linker polypeptide [Roseofilum casamattae]MDJ1182156.1 phycobilisome linker polypeptide [Roseofilum casamattae BLCC-M143]